MTISGTRIQQQLGHASIKTTMDIYGKPSVDDIQEDYNAKMEGMYG
jgi:integrase